MRNFVDQIGVDKIKRFVRNWETEKHRDISYVVCRVDDSSKEELKIEARLFSGLFNHLSTDYWTFDDFFALVNSPDEFTNNTLQVISQPWQTYLLKQLKNQDKTHSPYNAEEYLKTLEHGTPRYLWGYTGSRWPERLL